MQSQLKKLLFLCLVFIGSPVWAMIPDGGWWWNPSRSGSGYNIEVQNSTIFVSIYTFSTTGEPTYYFSSGTLTGDNRYSSALLRASGGQCPGCPYRAPTTSAAGTLQIVFASPTNATLTLNGESIAIERFSFGVNPLAPTGLMGEWGIISGTQSFPVYFAERIELNRTFASTIAPYGTAVAGYRSGDSPSIAVGYLGTDGYWYFLLDSSTSYYRALQFRFSGFNLIEGLSWVYLKTSTLSGSGTPFYGTRVASASAVQSGNGPRITVKSQADQAEHQRLVEARDQVLELSSLVNAKRDADNPGIQQALTLLRAMLQGAKQ